MKTFRVVRVNGVWQGSQDGEPEPLVTTVDQAMVRELVFSKARAAGPSRVLLFDADGTNSEERTFPAPKPKGYAGDWGVTGA